MERKRIRERVRKQFTEPSMTKQSFVDECDINKIMQRFSKTCGVDFLSRYSQTFGGHFGDFSDVTDYRTAIEQIRAADAVFMQLPAAVRARFNNDPAAMLDFCSDPKNVDEMISLGLAVKRADNAAVSTDSVEKSS